MSEYSRRTVVRGAAWSVPVIAVAAHAPAFASSHPPTIIIDFGSACANTGTAGKGCGTPKSLQVPLTVDNSTGTTALTFQITSMFTSNGTTAPTGSGTGVASGVLDIFATTEGFAAQNVCNEPTTATPTDCSSDGTANGSVTVAAGETGFFFIVAQPTVRSSRFSSTINFQLLDGGCNVIPGSADTESTDAISPNNCGNAPNDPA